MARHPPALNFQITGITIGQWSRSSVNPEDLVAKCYFGKKKLIWEIMGDDQEGGAQIQKLKKRIVIQWVDVLSLKSSDLPNGIEVLQVELSKPPTFSREHHDLQPGKHSWWTETDQDFTTNQSASTCRRHTLYFSRGVLRKNLEKIQSGDNFWSELVKVSFPSLQDPYFDNGGGNNNSQGFGHGGVGRGNLNMPIPLGPNAFAGEVPYPPLNLRLNKTPELCSWIESALQKPPTLTPPDLNTEEKNSMNNNKRRRIHQGSGIGEGNSNMATQFGANDGSQISTYIQSPSIGNQFLVPQGMNSVSGYGNSLNNNSNLDVNRSLLHQGSGIEEGNMATQFGANDGSQTYIQSPSITNQFLGTQGMNEGMNQMINTGEHTMIGYGYSNNSNINSSSFNVNSNRDQAEVKRSRIKRHMWDENGRHIGETEMVEGENEQDDNSETMQEGPQDASQKGQ